MYKGKKILALITARGGSKGIPGKNIKLLGGEPLINWTIGAAKTSSYIDRLILSTDDSLIASKAKEAGCDVPFRRPAYLAEDTSSSMDVIIHALSMIEEQYDFILLLQPTSPFRNSYHVDSIIEQAINSDSPMVVSVSRSKKHPAFMFSLLGDKLVPVLNKGLQKRRQDMSDIYEYNGALYFSDVAFLKKVKSFNCEEVSAYFMGEIESIDIDDDSDWKYAEYIIREGLLN